MHSGPRFGPIRGAGGHWGVTSCVSLCVCVCDGDSLGFKHPCLAGWFDVKSPLLISTLSGTILPKTYWMYLSNQYLLSSGYFLWTSQVKLVVENLPANSGGAGHLGSIPGSKRSPGRISNGKPLQYSCLENRMDRGAWWVAVRGVPKSWPWLSTCRIARALEHYLI